MSLELGVLIKIFFGMIVLNIVFAVFQLIDAHRGGKETIAPRISLAIWFSQLVIFILAGVLSETIGLITVAGFSGAIVQSTFLAMFARLILNAEFSLRRTLVVFIACWALTLVFYFTGMPFWAYAAPISLSITYPLIETVLSVFKSKRWKSYSFVAKFYIVNLILFIVHEWDFPFLRPDPDASMFGASFMFAILYLVSIVMPALINENERRKYEIQLENEVNRKTQLLLSSSKMSALGEMAGGVAHEINNPLAIIAQSVVVMDRGLKKAELQPDLRQTVDSSVERIKRTVDRIARIVRGLRDFSRDTENDPMATIAASEIIEQTLSLCSEKLARQGVQIEIDRVEPTLKLSCRAAQISQVLLNLISNAADAVEALPEKWIRVAVVREGQKVVFKIKDSGSGISPEIRAKIFQPFFTTKEIGKGTGLGLSVSLGIVQTHGGSLTLDDGAANTTFVLSLPALAS